MIVDFFAELARLVGLVLGSLLVGVEVLEGARENVGRTRRVEPTLSTLCVFASKLL